MHQNKPEPIVKEDLLLCTNCNHPLIFMNGLISEYVTTQLYKCTLCGKYHKIEIKTEYKKGISMAEQTVNGLLSMQKHLTTRRHQLDELKNNSSKRTRWMMMDSKEKIEEPLYDLKKVDTKLVRINQALFQIDQKIKESNAVTKVSIDIDFDKLMSEIE